LFFKHNPEQQFSLSLINILGKARNQSRVLHPLVLGNQVVANPMLKKEIYQMPILQEKKQTADLQLL
jgi:hypothetical protein